LDKSVDCRRTGQPATFIIYWWAKRRCTQAIALLQGFDFVDVMGDHGYDANDILDFIAQNDAKAVIPSKRIESSRERLIGIRIKTVI